MTRFAAFLGAFSICLGAAAGEPLPAPLETAFSEAQAHKDLVVSYTMAFSWRGAPPVTARFDAASNAWTDIAGDASALPPEAQRKFRNWKKSESVAGGLTYADYVGELDEVSLEEETPEALVYRFAAPGGESIRTRLIYDRAAAGLSFYSVEATRAFKPDPTARLETFAFQQTFARVLEGAPPLMTRVKWKARGQRLLSRVDEDYEIVFSDFSRP